MMSLPRRAFQDLKLLVTTPLAIVLAIVWLGVSGSAVALFPREGGAAAADAGDALPTPSQDQRSELERFLSSAPRVPLVIPNDGAKLLIVKFNDFQCPACGQSYLMYKPILAKYAASNPGAVKMVLKDYPLNPDCNSNVHQMLHPSACDAAVAVRLATARGKGDAMEDWLYTHQKEMTPASVRQAAKDIAGITDFDAKYAATMELVKGDIALGQRLNITQTPTFFLNGIKVEGAWAPQFFDQAIAYELARAK
jgi:protein-disulfide isomerase